MPYTTDERLKSYLDTNQLHREQMCLALLATDHRYSEVRPRHPRGGPDGGRDIEAKYKEEQLVYGAVGFINQANDSKEQKNTIKRKFQEDIIKAVNAHRKPKVFVFFTNVNFSATDKDRLMGLSKENSISICEIFDRERMRIILDGPDAFSIRYQYLGIPLSEAEQATFFAKWGDDIQSVISTGFNQVEKTLNRLLFLQEAQYPLEEFIITFELDHEYDSEEIGHFRLFCFMDLQECKNKIVSTLFGSTDTSTRKIAGETTTWSNRHSGIKHGISGGQWEEYFDFDNDSDGYQYLNSPDYKSDYTCIGTFSEVGRDKVHRIGISYNKSHFIIRLSPDLILKDLDGAQYCPFMNRSLAEKIESIQVYANGYILDRFNKTDFCIDDIEQPPEIPVTFSAEELQDTWVRVSHRSSSMFRLSFLEKTPARFFTPMNVED